MPSDRARVSFDPTRQYRGLVAQQGRVTLEADWNEAVAIAAERDRLVTLDVVGPLGTPDDGYAVSVIPPLGGSGAAPDLAIGAGTLYLGGERLELDEAITYSSQPDWLDRSTDLDWPSDAPPDGAAPSFELVYLVATEQEVSAVEDHELADVALGGPDTMQRLRMLQHVLRFPGDAETCAAAWLSLRRTLAGYGMAVDPATLRLGSTSSLQVGFANEPSTPSLCQPVATGGYLGAENQMIRVMVTDVESGVANIVWGYDDASFLYRLAPVSAPGAGASALALTLQSAPVDQYHEPAQNQYVELLRDAVALTASDWIASGLGYVSAVTATYDEATMQLSVSTAGTQGALSGAAFADYFSSATPQLYLRVWQQQLAAPPGSAVTLGDTGLTVTLNSSNGVFHPGDFWRFAVRPLEQQLVYPDRYLVAAQPPDGPLRFICPLAVLDWSGDTATVTACVPPFDSLTEISSEAGGCCTVEVGPGDVDDGAGLQRLLDRYVGRSAVTICLKPGTYTLTAPLEIGSQLELTLQGCAPGVVLQGPASPGKEFLLGLVAMQGAQGVTLRGLTVVAPAVAFESEEDSFSGLTAANRELLVAYARDLQVAICISLDGSSQLRIEGCALELPGGVSSNLLAAGILATGAIEGFELAGCQVSVSDAPTATPFYDLLAGEQVEAPFAITVGYLQVPTFATEQSKALVPQSANAEAEAEAGGGGAAGAGGAAEAGEGGGGAAPNETVPAQDIALVRLEVLHDAVIEDCELEGLTWAVLVIAKLGTTRLDQIVVRDCYGGIVLVSIENPSLVATFDLLDSGGSDLLGDLEPYGLTTLLDRTIVMATSIARLLPAQPPESDATLVPGRLTPTADAVAAIRPVVVNLFGEVADVTGSGGGGGGGSGGAGGGGAAGSNPATTAPPSAATTAAPTAATTAPPSPASATPAAQPAAQATPPKARTAAKPGTTSAAPPPSDAPSAVATGRQVPLAEVRPIALPSSISQLFAATPAGTVTTEAPATDTGTDVALRLDVADCQIDAVVATTYSSSALFVVDLSADTLPDVGSALVHGSRLRTRFPGGAAAGLIGVVESAVTGNVVANEVVPETKLIERAVGSLSLVLLPDQVPLGAAAIAVTGNVFVDPTLLPPRPSSLPAGLTDWDVLNTVVSYAPPASGS